MFLVNQMKESQGNMSLKKEKDPGISRKRWSPKNGGGARGI